MNLRPDWWSEYRSLELLAVNQVNTSSSTGKLTQPCTNIYREWIGDTNNKTLISVAQHNFLLPANRTRTLSTRVNPILPELFPPEIECSYCTISNIMTGGVTRGHVNENLTLTGYAGKWGTDTHGCSEYFYSKSYILVYSYINAMRIKTAVTQLQPWSSLLMTFSTLVNVCKASCSVSYLSYNFESLV